MYSWVARRRTWNQLSKSKEETNATTHEEASTIKPDQPVSPVDPKEASSIDPKEETNTTTQDKGRLDDLDKLIKPKKESTPTNKKNRRDHRPSKPNNRIVMTIKIPPHLAEHFRIPMDDLQLHINVLTRPQPNQ